jgi:membrane protein DedA with SNARE-associated domain
MRPLEGAVTALPFALLHIHIHHLHGPPFDYVGLAVAAALSWVGLPGPGEPVLIAAGILAAHHKLGIVGVVGVAFLAAAGGGMLGYMVGRVAGRAVLTAPGPLLRARLWAVKRGDAVFERYTVIAIILAPSWAAGINRVRLGTYSLVNLVAAAVWSAGIGFGAYLAGPPVIDSVNDLGTVTESILAMVIVIGVAGGAFRWWRERRRRTPVMTPPRDRSRTS